MDGPRDIELVFAPQEEGGFHVYAPDLPGLHSEGDTLEEAMSNAREALELYVEGLRETGHQQREPDSVTRALDEVADALGVAAQAFSSHAAHRTLERSEW